MTTGSLRVPPGENTKASSDQQHPAAHHEDPETLRTLDRSQQALRQHNPDGVRPEPVDGVEKATEPGTRGRRPESGGCQGKRGAERARREQRARPDRGAATREPHRHQHKGGEHESVDEVLLDEHGQGSRHTGGRRERQGLPAACAGLQGPKQQGAAQHHPGRREQLAIDLMGPEQRGGHQGRRREGTPLHAAPTTDQPARPASGRNHHHDEHAAENSQRDGSAEGGCQPVDQQQQRRTVHEESPVRERPVIVPVRGHQQVAALVRRQR